MAEKLCSGCLYDCKDDIACEHFCPIDCICDDTIEEYIEERRAEFYNEWFEYIEDNEVLC